MDYKEAAMKKHLQWRGKLEITSRVSIETKEELALAYTPGVAEPCLAIAAEPGLSFDLTRRWNTVAVITDGTAVLGLGDIGPEAGMPVMEGKCVLFKTFGGIDAIPLCIRSKDTEEIVRAVSLFAGSFGGINLEDISAPRCFEIEARLKEVCDIPIFHDDQHGTAIVTLAGLKNALKIVGKKPPDTRTVISGAGAAGTAISQILTKAGYKDIVLCNRNGAISSDSCEGANASVVRLASETNPNKRKGSLADVLKGADIFIGVSAPGLLTEPMIKSMAVNPIVFAMANPDPEIIPSRAKAAGARIVATGRSDFPNQINNVLAFPGIFRGALDARARDITDEMKLAAANALADMIAPDELNEEFIIPAAFDKRVAPLVAKAVMDIAVQTGVVK